MLIDTKKALDLSVYRPQEFSRFSLDLAALTIEARSRHETDQFITPFTYEVNFKTGKVICPEYDKDKDIRELFDHSPEVEDLCNFATDKNNYPPNGFSYLWISPPIQYPESRETTGKGFLVDEGHAIIQNFSGLLTNLSQKDCFELALHAHKYSVNPNSSLPESAAFFFKPSYGIDPLEFVFTTIIPRPDIYESITGGKVESDYQKSLEACRKAAQTVAVGMLGISGLSEYDYINLGARAEQQVMSALKITIIGKGSGCGLTNTEIMNQFSIITPFQIADPLKNSLFISHASECPKIRCPRCGWEPSESELNNMPSSCPGKNDKGETCGFKP
jgi:hypothetical protein